MADWEFLTRSGIQESWFHLVPGSSEVVLSELRAFAQEQQIVLCEIQGSMCRTRTALFSEWASALQFPDYFGQNWDAFWDCVTDELAVPWATNQRVLLCVLDADQLLVEEDGRELSTFLELMKEAGIQGGMRDLQLLLQTEPGKLEALRHRVAEATGQILEAKESFERPAPWQVWLPIGFTAVLSLGLILLALLAWGGTSSMRLGGPSSEGYRRLSQMAQAGDVDGLNQALLTEHSTRGKMIIMDYLADHQAPSSLPYLVQMLSFEVPWIDRFDSELRPTPDEVRRSAMGVLVSYGPDLAKPAVEAALAERDDQVRLLAAGVLACWGDERGFASLERLAREGSRSLREQAIDLLAYAARPKGSPGGCRI